MLVLHAGLGQEVRRAVIIRRVIGSLAGRDQDRDAVEAGQFMNNWTPLQPAALLVGARRRDLHQIQIRPVLTGGLYSDRHC